jgi:hypothetical protein
MTDEPDQNTTPGQPWATDLLSRLRRGDPCCADPCRVKEARSGCIYAAAADEIERLRAGWLAMLASHNECDASRHGACSAPDKCGCRREMERWSNRAKRPLHQP